MDHLDRQEGGMEGIHQAQAVQSILLVLLGSHRVDSFLVLEDSFLEVVDHHNLQLLMEDHRMDNLMGVRQMGSQEQNMVGSLGS